MRRSTPAMEASESFAFRSAWAPASRPSALASSGASTSSSWKMSSSSLESCWLAEGGGGAGGGAGGVGAGMGSGADCGLAVAQPASVSAPADIRTWRRLST